MTMKIALYIPNLKSGGAEKVFQILANNFVEKNIQVDLLLSKKEGFYIEELNNKVRIIELGGKSSKFDLFPLVKYINYNKPDFIISALTHTNIWLLISKVFSKSNTKFLISEHSITAGYNEVKKNIILNKLIKILYPTSDGIIAVSKITKEDLILNYSIKDSKIKVIYNPVITKSLMGKLTESIKDDKFIDDKKFLIYVGRLEIEKNIIFLLESIKDFLILNNYKLLIFGEGSQEQQLIHLINKYNLHNYVKMYGFYSNPYKYMEKSSALILPSLFEGFGNVVVEALYSGTKVILSTQAKAAIEVVEKSNLNILKFNPYNKDELLEAIYKLEQTNKLEKNNAFFNEFKEEFIAEKYLEFLRQVDDNYQYI